MTPVGIDLSWTCTGIQSDNWSSTVYSDGRGGEMARLNHIVWHVFSEVRSYPDPLIVMEGYSFGSAQRAHKMGELGGSVRLELWKNGHDFWLCPPTVLKKFACGKGNATKADVAVGVYKKWGFESSNDNIVDAFVLKEIAKILGRPEEEWPKNFKKEVVSKMELVTSRSAGNTSSSSEST